MIHSPLIAELEEILLLVVRDGGSIRDALVATFRAAGAEGHLEVESPSRRILRAACAHYNTKIEHLISGERTERCTSRRYATMVAMRRSEMSLPEIASALGYSDHSVVAYGLEKAKRRADIQRDGEAIWVLAFGKDKQAARAA
jgi:chromosomal replication initiation ATPase DnaA